MLILCFDIDQKSFSQIEKAKQEVGSNTAFPS